MLAVGQDGWLVIRNPLKSRQSMLQIVNKGTRLCDGLTRRQLMQVGSLTLRGLSLPQLLQVRDLAQPLPVSDKAFGRAASRNAFRLQGVLTPRRRVVDGALSSQL